jgi:hypothetical protein
MAQLTSGDRALVCADINRSGSVIQGFTILKADLRAAVDAIDTWVDDNSTAFNSAIPQPARGALTAKQKAALLMFVVEKRFNVS